jgi:hypothetical protein
MTNLCLPCREGYPHRHLAQHQRQRQHRLGDIASAVNALGTNGEGSFLTLETVRKKYPQSKAGNPYEAVWKRFFSTKKSNGRLQNGR